MDEDNKLSYFCLGLGLGVAVGILFAPKSGEETRAFLKSQADEGAEYVRRRSTDLKESAIGAVERGKQTIQRQKDHLSAAVDAGRQAYRDASQPAFLTAPSRERVSGAPYREKCGSGLNTGRNPIMLRRSDGGTPWR